VRLTQEVLHLQRPRHEHERQAVVDEVRLRRIDARPAVLANRAEEGEAEPLEPLAS
jgi:hypothetical protein